LEHYSITFQLKDELGGVGNIECNGGICKNKKEESA